MGRQARGSRDEGNTLPLTFKCWCHGDTFLKSIKSFNPLSTHFRIGTLPERKRRHKEIKVTCPGSTEGEGKSKLSIKHLPGSQILEITFNLTKNKKKQVPHSDQQCNADTLSKTCNNSKYSLSVFIGTRIPGYHLGTKPKHYLSILKICCFNNM